MRTADFEDVVKITVSSVSLILWEKPNENEEDCQVNPYEKNEVNKSIEENTSKNIEQIASNTIENCERTK